MQLPGKNSRIFLARIEWTAGNRIEDTVPSMQVNRIPVGPFHVEYLMTHSHNVNLYSMTFLFSTLSRREWKIFQNPLWKAVIDAKKK